MGVIIFLLIISVLLAGGFLLAYLYNVKEGQFDDDYSPAHRMLND
jgi:cbb3-type cytochrome oxidase maturation protein